MHIPDGFVSVPVAAATGAAALAMAGFSLRRAGRDLGESSVPVLGVTAAFIFVAQMLNFPILAGTSGHFLGALLACVVLGPWNGVVVMTAILLLQSLLMGDGGITALGANLLNMAVVGGLLSWAIARGASALARRSRGSYLAVIGVAAWLSVVLAAGACSLELAASGTVPLKAVLPPMLAVHAVIGWGEALLTVGILGVLVAARPDLVRGMPPGELVAGAVPRRSPRSVWSFVIAGMAVALLLAVFAAPWASSLPDGLERVAGDKGFDRMAMDVTSSQAPLAGYTLPQLGNSAWATALAGVAGALILFAIVAALGRLLKRIIRNRSLGVPRDGA